MREFTLKNFNKGLVTKFEDHSIPEEAASNSLNWLSLGDRIELSGGYSIIGSEQGAGKVTGLAVGIKVDNSKIGIRTRGQKIEYINEGDLDWTESGTDLLGADADGETTSTAFHTSLAGYQAFISSPNSGYFKMMLASPDDVKDLFDDAKNFKGYLLAADNRMQLWFRKNNKNYLFGTYLDVQNTVVYTSVSAEAIGASGSTNYTGTLSAISGNITCFNVVFTDGTQTAQDDKNGNFIGDATGTINYATGAFDITFDSVTTGSVTSDYQHEDSSEKGVADYRFTSPIRLATEGFFLTQPSGGDLLDISRYRNEFYCLHQSNAWLFSMTIDDLSPTNQIYRENIGLSSFRGAVPTGEGVYFIDVSNPQKPEFKVIRISVQNDEVEPQEISFNVDLSDFEFQDRGVAHKWDEYIVFVGRTKGNAVNNRLFAYHRKWNSFDILDYQADVLANFGNDLWAGDSSTDNVTQLFTGFSANGSLVNNFWEGKLSQLVIDQLKKIKRLTIRGRIGTNQSIKVSLAYDETGFEEIGTIDGTGSYVSKSSAGSSIGVSMVGSKEVGGGSSGIDANQYYGEFRIRSRKFDEVKIRFEATNVGYASVTSINYFDIRLYGQKNLNRFRATA